MATERDRLLQQAEAAFDEGEFEQALALGQKALEGDPDGEALDVVAHASAQLGHLEAAERAFEDLTEAFPDDPSRLLARADFLIRHGVDLDEGLELLDIAEELAEGDEVLTAECGLVRAIAFNELGAPEEALAALVIVLEENPENVEGLLEKAEALFELCRFPEAERVFKQAGAIDPEDPAVHDGLGRIAERKGEDPAGHFQRAHELDPEGFPNISLSVDEFDTALAEAIERLPDHAKPHLDNAVIDVQPVPSEEDLREGLSPSTLGVFRGTPLPQRSPTSAADQQTATITLFQRNLERTVRTREELIEEINITVLHEVGHLLGLEEDDMEERGLD